MTSSAIVPVMSNEQLITLANNTRNPLRSRLVVFHRFVVGKRTAIRSIFGDSSSDRFDEAE